MRLTFLRDYGLSRRIISIIRKLVIYFKEYKHAKTSIKSKCTVKSRQIRIMYRCLPEKTKLEIFEKSSLNVIEG